MSRSLIRALVALGVCSASLRAQAGGVARTIDEGTFVITRRGAAPATESFKIVRMDDGAIRATAQVIAGDDRINSSLMADSVGTPRGYAYVAKTAGVTTLDIRVQPRGHRLAVTTSDNRSNESMKEMPFTAGESIILDDALVHQLYFIMLGKRGDHVDAIDPRGAHHMTASLVARGLEPIDIARHSVTATHYSLVGGPTPRDFWLDAAGRLLRVEVPSLGLVATRDDLPRS